MSILLKDCRYIATQDGKRRVLENKDIYIEGDAIREIGSVSHEADEVIDASRFLAAPGLINTHTHVPMSIMRGYADDMPLFPWLNKVWAVEAKMTHDDVYYGSLLSCLEMIASGTTTFLDMYFFEDDTAHAAVEAGLRGFLSFLMIDPGKTSHGKDMVKGCDDFLRKWESNDLIQPIIGPHAVYTCSAETLNRSRELAEKHDTLLNIHLAETKKEVDDCVTANGKRVVEYLDSLGFLSERVIGAHAVHLSDGEIKTLADRRVTVSHNPTSNMKLAVGGFAPVAKMAKAGVNVTLGTDSTVSNNSLSMFEAMKTCALVQKHAAGDASALAAQQAFDMATINAAKYLKLDSGAIAEGKLADIILIDLDNPAMRPVRNAVSNIVYSANPGCVDTTIANGRILMRDRKILTIDSEDIYGHLKKHLE